MEEKSEGEIPRKPRKLIKCQKANGFMFSYITWIILQFVEPFYTYKCLTCYKKLKTICEPFSLFNFEHKELCKVKEFTRVLATQFSWNTHAYVYE